LTPPVARLQPTGILLDRSDFRVDIQETVVTSFVVASQFERTNLPASRSVALLRHRQVPEN
jgi:hypothetical protein